MPIVTDFEKELVRYSPSQYAKWRKVDLHNHTPASFDFRGNPDTALDDYSKQIVEQDLSVVMFTDHACLPDEEFISKLRAKTKKLIVPGVELNVFVDAMDRPTKKVEKNLYYHLLIGFDPDDSIPPSYWLTKIYTECNRIEVDSQGTKIVGVDCRLEAIFEVLAEAKTIIIPAHLHTTTDPFKSRSIDDIYGDKSFLSFAKNYCTALEVVDQNTAEFFDGEHKETDLLLKTCVQSSDSHKAEDLGSRPSYIQMEELSFDELKAGLELPFRTSMETPLLPTSFIVGVHIQGLFLDDQWLTFSPHCNVFMGVKGSGKTSMLECLRFGLGTKVPDSKKEDVNNHLMHILGPNGSVSILLKRNDGEKLLVKRSMQTQKLEVTFTDDRRETLPNADSLLFPSYILGWHEIEQAATEPQIRKIYLDTIAGSQTMSEIGGQARRTARSIRKNHEAASLKYSDYRDVKDQVDHLEGLKKGLRQLEDSNLIELKEKYEQAVAAKEEFGSILERLQNNKVEEHHAFDVLLPGLPLDSLTAESPLRAITQPIQSLIQGLFVDVRDFLVNRSGKVDLTVEAISNVQDTLETEYESFYEGYMSEVNVLTPDQRSLLESHQAMTDQTKGLHGLLRNLERVKIELNELLQTLSTECAAIVTLLDQRTTIRTQKVEVLSKELEQFDVKLSVERQSADTVFSTLTSQYSQGGEIFQRLGQLAPAERIHQRLKKAYDKLLSNLDQDEKLVFSDVQFHYFVEKFEDDDLRITFKADSGSEEYRPIDQLSAGQRCTAIFPLLLRMQDGPLILDQPEDNLDNRHIATMTAPSLREDKRTRQIMITSHNANLVVLSDPEQIVRFEADNGKGEIANRGFLSHKGSSITTDTLNILDGGRGALELRVKKYGTE